MRPQKITLVIPLPEAVPYARKSRKYSRGRRRDCARCRPCPEEYQELRKSLQNVLTGSNITNYATDNSSGGLAERRWRSWASTAPSRGR